MTPVTMDDRKRELRALLDRIQAHPERDWSEARARIGLLNRMLAQGQAAAR